MGCTFGMKPVVAPAMRTFLLSVMLLCLVRGSIAQTDHAELNKAVEAFTSARTDAHRDSLSGELKRVLKAVLDGEDAFTARFDDVRLSRVDAPDGRFRLFTWNIPYADGHHRFEGLLLVKEKKRRVIFELQDRTDQITTPANVELGPERWYGALYYDVVQTTKAGKVYYTLLGWKGYSTVETRKVIDVLSFKGSTPRFGAPLFGEGRVRRQREVYGFSFQASMSLRLEPAFQRIVMDHLSPTRPDLEGQAAFYGPDLSYDAYVWEKDHWVFKRDVDAREASPAKPYNPPPKNR